jgi:hypothetical protein
VRDAIVEGDSSISCSGPRSLGKTSAVFLRAGSDVYASNAWIFDAGGTVWCVARPPEAIFGEALDAQIRNVLVGLPKPLTRGGRIDATFGEPTARLIPRVYCRSFASIYVLGLWPTSSTVKFLMQKAVRAALPTIEALTLALPPPGGTEPNSGAQHGRA